MWKSGEKARVNVARAQNVFEFITNVYLPLRRLYMRVNGETATLERLEVKVAEHSFLVPMRYLSLFSNHCQLGSQNWQGANSTKEDCILICFIGLGTVTMATQLVVNQ